MQKYINYIDYSIRQLSDCDRQTQRYENFRDKLMSAKNKTVTNIKKKLFSFFGVNFVRCQFQDVFYLSRLRCYVALNIVNRLVFFCYVFS